MNQSQAINQSLAKPQFVHYLTEAQADLPDSDPVPGGLAVLPLYASEHPKPGATFGRQKIRIVEHDGFWWAMPGIALDTIPGDYVILVTLGDEVPHPVSFRVRPHTYPYVMEEATPSRGVSFLGSLISGGKSGSVDVTDQSVRNWQAQVSTSLPMSFPAKGDWDERFGRMIMAASKPTRHEHHLQLNATPNQLVLAPGRALCLDISESNSSNVDAATDIFDITLDHGEGLISIIRGVTDITVQPGDEVQQDAMIGRFSDFESGEQSHLEWLVLLNGEFVNPRLLTSSDEYTVPQENLVTFPWAEPEAEGTAPDASDEPVSTGAIPDVETATPEVPAPGTN
jgi:hypothetical protein